MKLPAARLPNRSASRTLSPDLWIGLGLVLATLAVFLGTCRHGYSIYDDPLYITKNARVLKGLSWDLVVWAFRTGETGNWAPLVWLSYALDISLVGPLPGFHHLVNVLLHALNVVLWYRLFRGLTGERWPSALLAALFAIHPLRVESVAWISERKDVLSGLFTVIALQAYAGYARRPSAARMAAVAGLLALGLMAKAMLVTVPVLLLLLDHWPLRRTPERLRPLRPWLALVWEKWPLFLLSAAFSVIAVLSQQSRGAVSTLENLPLKYRLINTPLAYLRYLGKTLWPHPLSPFYPYRPEFLTWGLGLLGLVVLAVLTVLVLLAGRRRRWLTVGWAWFLVSLLPVIGLLQVGAQAMADRYTYLPCIGLAILLAWGTAEAASRWHAPRWLIPAGWSLGLSALGLLAFLQAGRWRDDITLFRHAVRVTKDNFLAHSVLGSAYRDKGMNEAALKEYEECARIGPQFPLYQYMLGDVLDRLGRPQEALDHFRRMLELDPGNPLAELRIADLLSDLGQREASLPYYAAVLRKSPEPYLPKWEFAREAFQSFPFEARINLGYTLREMGRLEESRRYLESALALKPQSWKARVNLGLTLSLLDQHREAIALIRSALDLDPDLARVQTALGTALERAGRHREAAEAFRTAERLKAAARPAGGTQPPSPQL